MERNRKPCYGKSIAPKSFVSRVIKTVLINMTSCFTKKWLLQLLWQRHISTYSKVYIPHSQSFNSHCFMDWLRGNIITNSTLPNYRTNNSNCENKRFHFNFILSKSSKNVGLLEYTNFMNGPLENFYVMRVTFNNDKFRTF